ncbi:MAG: hypothetical protein Q8Q73_14715 [Stagnimonas sp.]|nr:hypothetical protein [Stagnimonas sp.]
MHHPSQLYGRIKRRSKYFGQTAPRALFPITAAMQYEPHLWAGNGNHYRAGDLDVFVRIVGTDSAIRIDGTQRAILPASAP